jgi:ATP-dependent DNA helicase RecG
LRLKRIYAKEKGKIINKDYQHLSNVSRQTAQRDLSELVNKEIFKKFGKGREVYYTIK